MKKRVFPTPTAKIECVILRHAKNKQMKETPNGSLFKMASFKLEFSNLYAKVMCHFQQDMLYKVIIGISDILHIQLNIPLKLFFLIKFICVDNNLEKHICKTMAKINTKGAITT